MSPFKIPNSRAKLKSPCLDDEDCWFKSRPDVHSMYCVDSICQKLLPPESHCSIPSECASYFFYGPMACSAKCKVENECGISNIVKTAYCCLAVPEQKECIPLRPDLLNGCAAKQNCLMESTGSFKCSARGVNSWLYGVILSIIGNLAINLGINFQKRSYKVEYAYIGRRKIGIFFIGSLLYGVGKVISFSAYIFGNQSLLASLSAFGLISNSMFAPIINNEVFTWKDFTAIFFVLLGSSIIVTNSGKSNKSFSLCELLKLYTKTETIVWFLFLIFSAFSMYLAVKFIEVNSDWRVPGDWFNRFLQRDVHFEDTGVVLSYVMLLLYVGISAFIAAFTSLFAKSFGEMVKRTIVGENQIFSINTHIFLLLLILFTLWQIYWLNRALQHYDALLTLPVFHAIWTVLSIFNAGIYFSDFEHFKRIQLYYFACGLVTIFMGSFFLGLRVRDKDSITAILTLTEIKLIKKTAKKGTAQD
jgi:magnesium transporter